MRIKEKEVAVLGAYKVMGCRWASAILVSTLNIEQAHKHTLQCQRIGDMSVQLGVHPSTLG